MRAALIQLRSATIPPMTAQAVATPATTRTMRPNLLASNFALVVGLLATACSSNSDDPTEALIVRSSDFAAGATTPLVANGYQFAFLANEATSGSSSPASASRDLNGDGDTLDDVAVLVDARTRLETSTGIAAQAVAMLAGELFLSVDETRDDFDWTGDGDKGDEVLLRFGGLSRDADLVAELSDADQPLVVAQGRLWFAAEDGPNGIAQDGLHFVTELAPNTPVAVQPHPPLVAIDEPELVGTQAGCVFVLLDETSVGSDLNDDGDASDANVLALVDAREATPVLRNTEKALASDSSPIAARATASGLVEVAFLVDETAQGGVNLNTQAAVGSGSAWTEPQCASSADTDTLDEVLHYIRWPEWIAGDEPSARNTGLPGDDAVVLFNGFVAVDCDEADHGGCDLNDDDDSTDTIARWTPIVAANAAIDPHSAFGDMHPIDAVPGGTNGLCVYDNRLFIAYSEDDDSTASGGTDLDGNRFDDDILVAWLNTTTNQFDFTHTGGGVHVGTTWMRPSPTGDRLCVAITERVVGRSLNDAQEGAASDELDSIPTFAFFSGSTLGFPGPGVAVKANDAGLSSARVNGFYKVDEAADNFDWNGDGDKLDLVVRQSQLSIGSSRGMGTASGVANAEAADYGGSPNGPSVAMFLTDEAMAGGDLNGDGDATDLVVRWFRFD